MVQPQEQEAQLFGEARREAHPFPEGYEAGEVGGGDGPDDVLHRRGMSEVDDGPGYPRLLGQAAEEEVLCRVAGGHHEEDGVLPPGDCGDPEKVAGGPAADVAGVLGEGALVLLLQHYLSLQDYLGLRRDGQVDGLALDELDGLPEERPGLPVLARDLGRRSEVQGRVCAYNDRHVEGAPGGLGPLEVLPHVPPRMEADPEHVPPLQMHPDVGEVHLLGVVGVPRCEEPGRDVSPAVLLVEPRYRERR